jgi:hypothetical protein
MIVIEASGAEVAPSHVERRGSHTLPSVPPQPAVRTEFLSILSHTRVPLSRRASY